jgi:hypothetical protein
MGGAYQCQNNQTIFNKLGLQLIKQSLPHNKAFKFFFKNKKVPEIFKKYQIGLVYFFCCYIIRGLPKLSMPRWRNW